MKKLLLAVAVATSFTTVTAEAASVRFGSGVANKSYDVKVDGYGFLDGILDTTVDHTADAAFQIEAGVDFNDFVGVTGYYQAVEDNDTYGGVIEAGYTYRSDDVAIKPYISGGFEYQTLGDNFEWTSAVMGMGIRGQWKQLYVNLAMTKLAPKTEGYYWQKVMGVKTGADFSLDYVTTSITIGVSF